MTKVEVTKISVTVPLHEWCTFCVKYKMSLGMWGGMSHGAPQNWLDHYFRPMPIRSPIKPTRTDLVPAESQKFLSLSYQQLDALGEPLSDFLTVRMRRAMRRGLKFHAVLIGRDASSLVREAVEFWAVSNGLDLRRHL